MKNRYSWLFILIITLSFYGCNRKSFGMMDSSDTIHINRFDMALFKWIETDDSAVLTNIEKEFPAMLEALRKALFQTDIIDSSVFYDYLINYYSEPALKAMYKDAITFYSSDSPATMKVKNELTYSFEQLKNHFPKTRIPDVYMHVSGLGQNIIVTDSLLSCSIDKYMGADYPIYATFFYDYQRKSMTADRLAIDCVNAWIKSDYPFKGKDNILLDRMIYEGKIIYILKQTGLDLTFQNIISITDDEYKWCIDHEPVLWTTIIERKHLYTSDITTTNKYFQHSSSLFISEQAPGNLGSFIGYRIIEQFMKQTKSSFEQLMNNNDAQNILQKSKYKP